jgi:hypothetical protein
VTLCKCNDYRAFGGPPNSTERPVVTLTTPAVAQSSIAAVCLSIAAPSRDVQKEPSLRFSARILFSFSWSGPFCRPLPLPFLMMVLYLPSVNNHHLSDQYTIMEFI